MGRALRQITNDALALSEVDRLALAAELIDSVEGSDDSEWNAEWSAEIDRRVEEADRTGERGRSWDVVRSELLERLARR
jgi:putative addiction module component (TIGR02574 family)